MLHPEETMLQAAHAFQRSGEFAPRRRLRQVVEHWLARLMQLGLWQARYGGRAKTLCQFLLAANAATCDAGGLGLRRSAHRSRPHRADDSPYRLGDSSGSASSPRAYSPASSTSSATLSSPAGGSRA